MAHGFLRVPGIRVVILYLRSASAKRGEAVTTIGENTPRWKVGHVRRLASGLVKQPSTMRAEQTRVWLDFRQFLIRRMLRRLWVFYHRGGLPQVPRWLRCS